MKGIVFISSGTAHPNSILCAKALNAKIYKIEKKQYDGIFKSIRESIKLGISLPKGTKYYFIESTLSILPILIRKYIFFEKSSIIHRSNAYEYDILIKKRSSKIQRYILKYLLSKIDYCIAISKIIQQQILKVFPERKIDIVYTTIYNNEYFLLNSKKKENSFLFIGNYNKEYDYKGIKKLIEFTQKYNKETNNKISLDIVGRDTNLLKTIDKNINIHGFDNPKKYLEKAKYYIHNAEIEAGGTSVLEAMAIGVIPIITNNTGNKDILEKLSLHRLVYNYGDYKAFKKAVNYVINLSHKEYENISYAIKKGAKFYASPEKNIKKLKKYISKFISE